EDVLEYAQAEIESTADNVVALLRRSAYDLAVFVIRAPDIVHHALFRAGEVGARNRPLIDRVYEQVDAAVGRVLTEVGDDWLVVLVSDHGAGPAPVVELNLNAWLGQRGLLAAQRSGRGQLARAAVQAMRSIARHTGLKSVLLRRMSGTQHRRVARMRLAGQQIDWTGTRAYAVRTSFPAGGILVNLRGRQPQGIVEPGEQYERVRDEVISALRDLKAPGGSRPLISEIYRREELYHGPHVSAAPDIVFLTDPELILGDRLDRVVQRMDA